MEAGTLIRSRLFIYILLTLIIFCGCDYGIANKDKLSCALEQAYFEGQKDAIEGDIRIRTNIDGCWIWIKSPWDDGSQPIFNPTVICNGNNKNNKL